MNRRKSTKFNNMCTWERASQVVRVVKNPPVNAWDMRCGFDSWIRKIPWRRAWQPTPVFLPWESHGKRSLAGYSPWGHKWVRHDLETKQRHPRPSESNILRMWLILTCRNWIIFGFLGPFLGLESLSWFFDIQTLWAGQKLCGHTLQHLHFVNQGTESTSDFRIGKKDQELRDQAEARVWGPVLKEL